MDNMENMDFEAIRDKQADELMQLLDERRMKELQLRLEDMNEFDVAEFLSEIGDNRMPMVFRLLSKQMAADVFANFDSPEQEQIINSITDSELSAIIEELYVDDAVDMMEELPANLVDKRREACHAHCNAGNQTAYKSVPQLSRKFGRQHNDGRVRGSQKIHERARIYCAHTQDRRG